MIGLNYLVKSKSYSKVALRNKQAKTWNKKFETNYITKRYSTTEATNQPQFNKDATKVRLTIQTPERSVELNLEVDSVGVPGSAGDFVVGPNSIPTLTELRPGVILIKKDGSDIKYFTSGGFAVGQEDSSLSMSLGECLPLEDLDLESARAVVTKYQNLSNTEADEEAKAIAQITFDTASAIVKALEGK